MRLYRQQLLPSGKVHGQYIRICMCDTSAGPVGGVCTCGGAIPTAQEMRMVLLGIECGYPTEGIK